MSSLLSRPKRKTTGGQHQSFTITRKGQSTAADGEAHDDARHYSSVPVPAPVYIQEPEGESEADKIAMIQRLFSKKIDNLMVPGRVYIYNGEVSQVKAAVKNVLKKTFHVFLFNDLLLKTKSQQQNLYGKDDKLKRVYYMSPTFKLEKQLSLERVSVFDLIDTPEFSNSFELTNISPMGLRTTVTFSTGTSEEKSAWVKAIQKYVNQQKSAPLSPAVAEWSIS